MAYLARVDALVIHHTAGTDTPGMSADDIRRYHVNVKGWRDAGYHVVTELIEADIVPIILRPWDEQGAHCIPLNNRSLGLAMVGNFELAPPPAAMVLVQATLVRSLVRRLGIPIDRVLGHREGHPGHTACPGKHFDMGVFRDMVR